MTPGHNSDPTGKAPEYVKRFITLFEDAANTAEEIRDLAKEAKTAGIEDVRALKTVAKQQMEDADKKSKREAFEEAIDKYRHALGLLD